MAFGILELGLDLMTSKNVHAVPGKPLACNLELLSLNNDTFWDIVACNFELLTWLSR